VVTRSGVTPVTALAERNNAVAEVAVLAEHDVHQSTVAINRAIEIPPPATHPDIRFIDIPTTADPAFASLAEVLGERRHQLGPEWLNSSTSQFSTVICIHVPTFEAACAAINSRKLRCPKADRVACRPLSVLWLGAE
jgi:hypothetical protein